DERLFGGGVDAEVTGMSNWRRADAQMDLGGTGFTQHVDDARGRRPAHDAVVDQRDSLSAKHGRQWIEFEVDVRFTLLLPRLDERAADVAVLDQAFAVRQAGGTREPDGGGYRRVRDRHHEVGA